MSKLQASLFAALAMCAYPAQAQAHLPNLANYQLEEQGGQWRLRVSMSTDGMHQVMKLRHPGEKVSELSTSEYERRLVVALEEGIDLEFDGVPLRLENPRVELASHQSNVDFTVQVPVAAPTRVHAHIDALHEQGHQNNVFRVVRADGNQYQVLKYDNGFEGELILDSRAKSELRESPMGLALGLILAFGVQLSEREGVALELGWWS